MGKARYRVQKRSYRCVQCAFEIAPWEPHYSSATDTPYVAAHWHAHCYTATQPDPKAHQAYQALQHYGATVTLAQWAVLVGEDEPEELLRRMRPYLADGRVVCEDCKYKSSPVPSQK